MNRITKLLTGFKKSEKILFLVATSLILVIVSYIFIFEPIYKKWEQLDLEFETVNSRLFKNMKLLANKELLEKDYNKYKEYIQKEGDEAEEIASILKEIESTALSCGVKITSIKPKDVKQFKNYKKLNVELISEARIDQFLKFIYDLKGSKKLLEIERLVLSIKGTQSDILKGTFLIYKISFLTK